MPTQEINQAAESEPRKLGGWQRKINKLTREKGELIEFTVYLMNRLEKYEKINRRGM